MHRMISALHRLAAELDSAGDGSLFCDDHLLAECYCCPVEQRAVPPAG
jgi:hypothetical protein